MTTKPDMPNKPPGSPWTDDQWQAIARRGGHLLVAAAAGSGKTAVLVERIIRRISEGPAPIDVDRLLVATFTKAAADEMRERIREALERRLEADPQHEHLRRQLAYIHRASITTLHSFCLEVVRQHVQAVGLSPAFRIGNETETELIRRDVLESVFEEQYAEQAPDSGFWKLLDSFSGERSDEPLYRLVERIFEFSRSHPWPDAWLQAQAAAFAGDGGVWRSSLLRDARLELSAAHRLVREALRLAERPGGPAPYADALRREAEALECAMGLADSGEWNALYAHVQGALFDKLKPVRGDAYDKRLQEQAKALRDQAKAKFAALKEELFARSPEQHAADCRETAPLMEELVRLVGLFSRAYERAKREKGIVDFSDLEHYCLHILRAPESTPERAVPSPAALAFREHFEEVLIDEYQDTNQVQEAILALISREPPAGNRFMVGDVKQSIYRFRLADPGLFLRKYAAYPSVSAGAASKENTAANVDAGAASGADMGTLEASPNGMRIDLARNFRSRKQILEGVNFLFRRLMTETVGEMSYDEAARLIPGALFPDPLSRVEGDLFVDVLLLDKSGAALDAAAGRGVEGEGGVDGGGEDGSENVEEPEDDATTAQREARMIAMQISRLMGGDGRMPFMVTDKASGGVRPVRYRDIVVLLRATRDWAPTLVEELGLAGIPAYAELSTGYFSAVEVETVLSLLQIIDNPYQDIPLAAVLRSPIVKLSAEEMAAIRSAHKHGPYFDAVRACAASSALDAELRGKLERFLELHALWRREARYSPVSELLWRIYRLTGYYETAGAMPGGTQRQANLRALYDRARQYESTSFRGLFRFLRFIERMREHGGDLGAAGALGEQEDVVRIMSIHKSKGLEFPVVFVAGMGKSFNLQDLNGPFLMHKELGFGPKRVDTELNISYPTLAHLAIRKRIRLETLAEEMRVLYVALTRPKEKLFLVGSVRDAVQAAVKWELSASGGEEALPDGVLAEARCYLDWIGPALMRHPDAHPLRELAGVPGPPAASPDGGDSSRWRIAVAGAEGLAQAAAAREARDETIMQAIYRVEPVHHLHSARTEAVERMLGWEYPHGSAAGMFSKTSVSELKRRIAAAEERAAEWEDAATLADAASGAKHAFRRSLLRRPRFMEERKLTPAERGTLYHAVMQHLPLDLAPDPASVRAWIEREVAVKRLPPYAAAEVEAEGVCAFLRSGLADRMRASADVRRELPFSFGLPASDVYEDAAVAGETILLQGVMDCIFAEPDGWVLVDYKTDTLQGARALEEAQERYALQIRLYCDAIGRIFDRPVKEAYLYMFDGALTVRMM